ncbi:MAG: IS200/IS605 family transposase [Dehalococcoidia bacterium]|nr:IS200/IS605 family transposase [Dehalococcoidia bacterium]
MVEDLCHVWFSTKMRKIALVDEIGAEIRRLLREVATRTSIKLLEMETVADHVHLLMRLEPEQALSSAMHRLKGATSRYIFLKFPELKVDMGHNSFWQKGYGFRRLDPSEVPRVRRYMRSQEARALRHT